MDADAIVVGAGPGGASAALCLARQGRHVLLLDRQRFPRDKSCGDGLTRFTTRLLAEMDVLEHLPPSPPSRGARVFMRGRGNREFRYPDGGAEPIHGAVVPRMILDNAICERARFEGAELWEETLASRLLYENGVVVGVDVVRGGEEISLRAPVVIAADGAASRMAHQAGLVATPREGKGYAIRGYYEGIEGLADLLEIYMPLLDPTDRYLLPSYGWVFPTGPGTANIGVGLVHRARRANVRELLDRFLDELREDPRFRDMACCGQWMGAPLRFDFSPERCMAPGLLLVGDAAGMISPFTGEGIGYALASGRVAAQTVSEALHDTGVSRLDLSAYPAALGREFTGYFEAGRQSTRRYQLIWHVLESTFQNEKPLFDMCRRAALFPEGIGESYAQAALEDVAPALQQGSGEPGADCGDLAPVRADLLAIGEVLIDTVRRDWPFLAQVVTADQTVPGIPFRPALLLVLAGRLLTPRRSLLVPVGAAVELGYVAALAHSSVGDDDSVVAANGRGGRSANWGNMCAVMVGDFLLSKAYEMSAGVATLVSREISTSLSEACEGYVLALRNAYNADLTTDEHLGIVRKKTATLFELPCRLGAHLSDAPERSVTALSVYGRHLGMAYQLIDDVLAASGRASELGCAIGSDLGEGIYSFPIIHALGTDGRDAVKRELARLREGRGSPDVVHSIAHELGGFDASIGRAMTAVERARKALRRVQDGAARTWLLALADHVANRARAYEGFVTRAT